METTLLLTNDDGYEAAGLQLLIEALEGLGEIYVAAPLNEQSASSHSLSLRKKISCERVSDRHYKVGGTPTDSVLLGVHAIMQCKPSIIVSGINHGPNMGEDVTYSGTVAAAREGAMLGVPSVALSCLQRTISSRKELAHVARVVVEKALQLGMPKGTLLNVNIPNPDVAPIQGVKMTKLGSREYDNLLDVEEGEDGMKWYQIGGSEPVWRDDDGSDIASVRMGYVSVTPLHLDPTDYKAIVDMERWRFDL